jgi:hypothetical protein
MYGAALRFLGREYRRLIPGSGNTRRRAPPKRGRAAPLFGSLQFAGKEIIVRIRRLPQFFRPLQCVGSVWAGVRFFGLLSGFDCFGS